MALTEISYGISVLFRLKVFTEKVAFTDEKDSFAKNMKFTSPEEIVGRL